MSENNKNMHKCVGPYNYDNVEEFLNEASVIADSMKEFEIPMHSFNVDPNHYSIYSHVNVDCSAAFINAMLNFTAFMNKILFNQNSAIPDLFEFAECVNSSNGPLSEAEDILTPLFQSKAKELCPSDDELTNLTMNEVVHIIAGNCPHHKCNNSDDDCNCCDGCDCCDGNCNCCDNDCDRCDNDCNCYEDDCDCCNNDCNCASEDSDDGGILDPNAPLDVKVTIVCSSLFSEYKTYEQLPGEMKKAVDLARDAYSLLVGDSLRKLQAMLMRHFNDMPTTLVSQFFDDISARASYVLNFLDIIDPDHSINNFPEDSGDCSEDAPEVAPLEK